MRHIAFFSLALALTACGGSSSTATTESSSDEHTTASAGSEQPLVAPADAQIGDRTTCLVSGEEFVVTESSPSVVHEGHTYYFCCPGCDARFEASPAQYLTPAAADAS